MTTSDSNQKRTPERTMIARAIAQRPVRGQSRARQAEETAVPHDTISTRLSRPYQLQTLKD